MTDLLSREEWTKRASQKVARTQLFINGKFVDAASGKTFESINPRDNSIAAVVAEGDKEDIDRAVVAARKSFTAGVWSEMAPVQRKNIMLRWVQLMRENINELALLETMDVGKPIGDSVNVDIESAANNLQWFAETIDELSVDYFFMEGWRGSCRR
ncbi:MAG: hypothetical protein RLZZ105_921 [Actinomycetota bacterium]